MDETADRPATEGQAAHRPVNSEEDDAFMRSSGRVPGPDRLKVTLFTDSLIVRDAAGQHVPVRDQFPRFISRLASAGIDLRIASRCARDPERRGLDPIDEQSVTFVELPFYENTEDYFRRRRSIRAQTLPIVRELVTESDVVLLRIHHALAAAITSVAEELGRPLVSYYAGPPILASVRANYPGRGPKDLVARIIAARKRRVHARIAAKSDWSLFVDPVERAELGSPADSQPVVPSLVEHEDVVTQHVKRVAGEPLRVCFAGRIYRHKGVFDLLRAAQDVANSGRAIELEFAGQGPDEEPLRDAAGVTPGCDVRMHGALRRDELYALMRSCHVFTLPSYGEGMPKVLLEAWAAGLAVVTTPVGAIPDHIQHGVQGLLHPPGDINSLTEVLRALWDDESVRSRLAEAGMRSVVDFTWSAEIEKIASLLKTVGSKTEQRFQ